MDLCDGEMQDGGELFVLVLIKSGVPKVQSAVKGEMKWECDLLKCYINELFPLSNVNSAYEFAAKSDMNGISLLSPSILK